MIDNFDRFDMSLPPKKTLPILKPVKKLLCLSDMKKHKPQITYRGGVENLSGPFLMLGNHNAYMDIKVASTLLGKNDANYVVAIDGFIGREWLLRNVGCICKRKFTNDITLIRQLKRVIKMGNVAVIYPEARYSLCGTTAVLPKSLGQLVKLLDVPLVTLICHGHHVNSPFWDTSHDRGVVPTEATFTQLLTIDEVRSLSPDEINQKILEEFKYDDFMWQREKKIKVSDEKRADGLEKVLYQCPHCVKEYAMESDGTILRCTACGKEWEMTEYGSLRALDGETEFDHIPDWYEWERMNVRKEVENGSYSSGELKVQVDSLPNSKKYIDLGKGTLVHDMNGFRVTVTDADGDVHTMQKDVPSMYSCHIEYRYLFKKGDCVDLNTLTDTWYCYPEGEFAVTKMALATEELYRHDLISKGREITPGLF